MKFELNKDECAKYDAWDKEHHDAHHGGKHPYAGAVGGYISFVITSTSIGRFLSVECGMCRRAGKPMEIYSHSLTDFDDW